MGYQLAAGVPSSPCLPWVQKTKKQCWRPSVRHSPEQWRIGRRFYNPVAIVVGKRQTADLLSSLVSTRPWYRSNQHISVEYSVGRVV